MKNAVAVIRAVCLLCALAPAVPRGVAERAVLSVSADDEEADYTCENLTYRKYADHIEITGCSEDAEKIVIPDTIDGLPVTHIKDYAFFGNEKITSAVLPESIVYSGIDSFADRIALACISCHPRQEGDPACQKAHPLRS